MDDKVDGKTVLDVLQSKHPPAGKVDPSALISPGVQPPEIHLVFLSV